MPPQKLLASIACPSVPFLAPRLLRISAPAAVLTTRCSTTNPLQGVQRPIHTKSAKFRRPRISSLVGTKKSTRGRVIDDETKSILAEFRQACDARDPQKVLELYPTLREAKALTRDDTLRIAQTLHTIARFFRYNKVKPDVKLSDLLSFARQLTQDIQENRLAAHPYAFVHLITLYKNSNKYTEGYQLWQWLVEQDNSYVSQAAYGAVIELLAFGGIISLSKLEDLYHEALKRFPGTFAEYHLSPDAIVPDRTRPIAITGLPMTLLQGIVTARLQYRDWRNAYLAFDTALRLYPTLTPIRYYELFMIERPINEAYAAYLMACRVGIALRPSHLSTLIARLKAAMKASSSQYDRVLILRGIVNATYAYLEAGGTLSSIHVGSFLGAFETLLPEKLPQDEYSGDSVELRNMIVVAAHEILSGLTQAGFPLEPSSLNALIHLAGKLQAPDLLTTVVEDAKTAKVPLGPIGIRTALNSAGMLGNTELIEEFWSKIASSAELAMEQIPYEDWISFVRACRRARHIVYFRDQLLKNQHAISSRIEKRLMAEHIVQDSPPKEQSFTYITPARLESELDLLKEQMANIQAVVMSGQPLDVRNAPFYMSLDPDRPTLGSIENLRAIYDEMTTDPHQPPAQNPPQGSPAQPVLSSTGLPLDELRFQNWVSILHMMDDAESYELNFQAELDRAIQEGWPRPEAIETFRLKRTVERHSFPTKDELRKRIRQLRGSDLIAKQDFHKHESED